MAGSLELYADILDSQGTWQRKLIRIRPDGGYFAGLRDLDYFGTIESVSGSLVGADACPCGGHRKDEEPSEWLDRLKSRMKGST